MDREKMQHRDFRMADFCNREDGSGNLYLEGYFAVFNDTYTLWPGATESIAPGAFQSCLGGDVRALYNHNHDLVLGRTVNNTLELKEDGRGLWGRIRINKEDSDAMNVYSRVLRGDVSQCSFGFEIAEEEILYSENGETHWTIKKIEPLYEISPCVFPAYQETTVSARKRDFEDIQSRKIELWRQEARKKLKGENYGA